MADGNDGGNAGGNSETWVDTLEDDLKGFVGVKGWQSPADAVKSYKELESFHGAGPDRLIKLPSPDDENADWDPVWAKLGRPEAPDGYRFKQADADGTDKEFFEHIAKSFYEIGVPARQAQAVVDALESYSSKMAEETKVRLEAEVAAQKLELQKEWGSNYDANLHKAKVAARALGVSDEVIDTLENVMGYKAVMQHFANIAEKLTEDTFEDGDGDRSFAGGMTPERAREEIAQLNADTAFRKRYLDGDRDALAKMERLHQIAYGA